MREIVINREGKEEKKRGRKRKENTREERKKEKNKFFVDLGNDQDALYVRIDVVLVLIRLIDLG
jgi:hypothetical protein